MDGSGGLFHCIRIVYEALMNLILRCLFFPSSDPRKQPL